MKFDDFIDALHDHGWRQNGDAQHTNIKKLWKKMFPLVSELEDNILELNKDIENLMKAKEND